MSNQEHTPDITRENLGFASAVDEFIRPILLRAGFICTNRTCYSVKFLSAKVAVDVSHDPLSYEIEFSFAHREVPSERYNLTNVVDAAIGCSHKKQTHFEASERTT